MAKNLKFNIKNTQLAEALNLGKLKGKLNKSIEPEKVDIAGESQSPTTLSEPALPLEDEPRRVKARSKVVPPPVKNEIESQEEFEPQPLVLPTEEEKSTRRTARSKLTADEELQNPEEPEENISPPSPEEPLILKPAREEVEEDQNQQPRVSTTEAESKASETVHSKENLPLEKAAPAIEPPVHKNEEVVKTETPSPIAPKAVKLGPTGRHVNDLIRQKPAVPPPQGSSAKTKGEDASSGRSAGSPSKEASTARSPKSETTTPSASFASDDASNKKGKAKEFTDLKPLKKQGKPSSFDSRDRQGLRESDDEQWRRRRPSKQRYVPEDVTIRPSFLKVCLPISVKDLAAEMKLKASQLVSKLFMQGVILTLNDFLDDETTIQLLGQEFGCTIEIDVAEEQRIRITDKSIKQEIEATESSELIKRAPIVAFMGHVDHGKTSLIDAIRKSNRVAGEAGAITQHIGAFRCSTPVGEITILDTPGHEAFSAMRTRGAEVTDIIVLVIAGDEGLKPQTVEAIQQAKNANVTIVIAVNKSDKPNFNAENVYQQLTSHELLPEAWGGSTIAINCSAVTGQGIPELLEMLALQAEILELKANPNSRARGTVIESEMHKGLGAKATVLIQNGTLRLGDSVVFGLFWGRVKTMHNEHGSSVTEAGPSTPIEITGLSGLPEAGQEFIVVKNEREAREIAEARLEGQKNLHLQQKKKISIESLVQQAASQQKKILNVVLRADVQGSLEALKTSILNIKTNKIDVNIISAGVGEVSESDIQLAAASQAIVIGFHTEIESHADSLIKQTGVKVYLHDIIYHAIDDVKRIMLELLDKIPQENDMGAAEVRATFKASQFGVIAGCIVTEGIIQRNNKFRVMRNNEVIWKGGISSLKRIKDDVREVKKGFECGILLDNFNEIAEGDIIQAYEIIYLTQEL